MIMASAHKSDFIYFTDETAEPVIQKGEVFNHISIPRGAYTTVINRGSEDTYFRIDPWWIQNDGWHPIEPSSVPERLRTLKLLLNTGEG